MTYRPYPSPARALHQHARHVHREDVPVLASPSAARFALGLAAAFQPNAAGVLDSLRVATLFPAPIVPTDTVPRRLDTARPDGKR